MKVFIKKHMRKLLWGVLGLITVFGLYQVYDKILAPTRIAFVNFPEFRLSGISKANDNLFIRTSILAEDELDEADHYSAIFIFGRGFHLDETQQAHLLRARNKGVPIYVDGATNPAMDFSNLKGETLDAVSEYLNYGGDHNNKSLLNYVRKVIDGKKLFTGEIALPEKIDRDVLFHLDETLTFKSPEAFKAYGKQQGFIKDGAPVVALLTSVPGPFNANRDHLSSLITALQDKGLNVYPIAAFDSRAQWLRQLKPDLVVLMPHGRFGLGRADSTQAWLKANHIPVMAPISVFEEYDKWNLDPRGMSGGIMNMSVTLPELDGVVAPYAIIAQYRDENGYLAFNAIPDRMEKFAGMVAKRIALKNKPNSQKKLAIYYFKGPGKSALAAANLEVGPSLYNLLLRLKQEGYEVNGLPASVKGLEHLIQQNGAVLGSYAEGSIQEFMEKGKPALVPAAEYEKWAKQDITPRRWQSVLDRYGRPPGAYMALQRADTSYLAVARLQFGNVVLLPQPMAGTGDDTFKIIHGTYQAPPHTYIASYLWSRHAFKADAIMHFGTHGSLEFTPGKQVALSGNDWPDVLIGNTPHFYVYTISNVGEGMIAKRRTYATLLSYLTPPFMTGGTYNELAALEQTLHKFTALDDPAIQLAYARSISQRARTMGLYHDLQLKDSTQDLSVEEVYRLAELVEEIGSEKVTAGLYTIGKAYTPDQVAATVRLMTVDPITYGLAQLDVIKGLIPAARLQHKTFIAARYSKRAEGIISDWQQGRHIALPDVVSPVDIARAKAWQAYRVKPDENTLIRSFIGMAEVSGPGQGRGPAQPNGRRGKPTTSSDEEQQLRKLVVNIRPFADKVAFIKSLQSDKQFQRSSGLLDPASLQRAKTIATAIPEMKKAVDMTQDPDVNALLRLMQRQPLRQRTFMLLTDEKLAASVAAEQKKHHQQVNTEAASRSHVLQYLKQPEKLAALNAEALRTVADDLSFYIGNIALLTQRPDTNALKAAASQADKLLKQREQREADFAAAVSRIEGAVTQLSAYQQALHNSTENELQAVIDGLNGGYTLPSPGGDPINNPQSIPTGRNLYSIDAEKTPSAEAWEVGKMQARSMLEKHQKAHNGKYPQKVAFTLWAGDFIQTEGAMLAQIFYLLGIEPVRDAVGRVADIRLIPAAELERSRVDVVVQTSGQLRDLAASRLELINKAVAMAAAADEAGNPVKTGAALAEKQLKETGLSPREARELSTLRVFGGANGNYGTGITGMVEQGDRWQERREIADTYLNNMGALYNDDKHWAYFRKGVFETALQHTEVIVQPRSSNTWGALSLDHVYEFAGGLNLTVREVTGSEPTVYFSDSRNPANPRMQELKEAIWIEARSTLLNPKYISELLKGGASSANIFAETFRNTYGWNVMKPEAIDAELWNQLYQTYVQDVQQLGTKAFFDRENPYALQELTAVMLETVRKGLWKPTGQQLQEIVDLHQSEVHEHGAGCSGFVCGNAELNKFIAGKLTGEARPSYEASLKQVKETSSGAARAKATVLKKVEEKATPHRADADQHDDTDSAPANRSLLLPCVLLLALLVLLLWYIRKKNRTVK